MQHIAHGLCPDCEAERTRRRLDTEPWRAVYGTKAWRAVRARAIREAGGQCQAMSDGVRCQSRHGLEGHHIVPLSQGGEAFDRGNVVVLCPRHHRLADEAMRS